ncbi:MAG: ArnT family glycosyltransferase [Saprospiraceae bacterium]
MYIYRLFANRDESSLQFLWLLAILTYFWNLGLNNIWTPNEGFYAEAVREMLESGDYVNIFYNYEPRFNKPPLFYWLITLSCKIFGLNEWAIRLPSTLAGLGTAWLIFKIGNLLENRKLGISAAIVTLFSFQFVINARYASPEIVLTFFFTLTLYWFLKGYHRQYWRYILLSYIALGLAVLTKGYPYLIIISGIIILYVFFNAQYNIRSFLNKIGWLKPHLGLPLSFLIGMSWIIYMLFTYGNDFYEVWMDETARRAFNKPGSLKPFYYLEANTWGFLPYSLTFYIGLIYLIINRFRSFNQHPVLQFSLAWFVVMLMVFTLAKGKIPTYFIQGYPGMALFTAYFILNITSFNKYLQRAIQFSYWLPGLVFITLSTIIIYVFKAPLILYMLPILPLLLLYLGERFDIQYFKLAYFPYITFAMAYLAFTSIVFPFMEKDYRNHDKIGEAIIQQVPDAQLPLLMQDVQIHNLPYYAQRKIIPYLQEADLLHYYDKESVLLALVPANKVEVFEPYDIIWQGLLYDGSETRTLEFVLNILQAQQGKPSLFSEYYVIYKNKESEAVSNNVNYIDK